MKYMLALRTSTYGLLGQNVSNHGYNTYGTTVHIATSVKFIRFSPEAPSDAVLG